MQRYLLTIEYDGSDFHGWQKQPDQRTVEGELEKAFSQLYQSEIDLIGQGRTDAGVHAEQQTAHVDLPDSISVERVLHAMRGLLPQDILLKRIDKAGSDFHARFDAVSRCYEYWITTEKSPLLRRITWFPGRTMNLTLLKKCAGVVTGEHDFRCFCIQPDHNLQTTICTISECRWEEWDYGYRFTIRGDRFLRQMVRRLVGTMVRIAAGEESIGVYLNALKGGSSEIQIRTAPPQGLRLKKVEYL